MSIDAIMGLMGGMTVGIIVGITFVWIGHAILPDSKADPVEAPQTATQEPTPEPDLAEARLSAYRSLLVVMPILIWFILSAASASYAAVMIKVASMGQQASLDHTKAAAKSLLLSTIIGGVAATLVWQVMSIRSSLLLYVILTGLVGLLIGPRVFRGAGLRPAGPTWSYGYLTFLIVLAPAVTDPAVGGSAGEGFYSRLFMFVGATLYGMVAVFVFDLLFESRGKADDSEMASKDVIAG